MKIRFSWLAAALLVWLSVLSPVRAQPDFLEPDQAFRLSARVADDRTIALRFEVAPGYYLYRERFDIHGPGPQVVLSPPAFPAGQVKFDETFQKDVEVYHETLEVPVGIQSAPGPFALSVTHQGCADKGLCYPPQVHTLRVRYEGGALRGVEVTAAADGADAVASPAEAPTGVFDRFGQVLRSGNLWAVAGVFALAGVLLSFTPCVLPMVPILSSIVLGQGGAGSRRRGLALSAAYALGMALVYTGMGVAAGLAGEGLAAALQTPMVLGAFALLLVALSLSMFGVYELQMPSSWQTRLSEASGRFEGGRYGGVFVMGGVSALIVGPCVAAPLAGALVYISQTRDVVLGGVALFAMACGMSVPLMLVGLSAGALLPKAGAWMEWVKRGFGVMLLAVAAWMVWPVLPFGRTAVRTASSSSATVRMRRNTTPSPGDVRFLCRLVRVLQGDGALHVHRSGCEGAHGPDAAAAGRRDGQQRRRQGPDAPLRPVRAAGDPAVRCERAGTVSAPRHRLPARERVPGQPGRGSSESQTLNFFSELLYDDDHLHL